MVLCIFRCYDMLGSPRIRAPRRLSEVLNHAPDDIPIPSDSRDVISAAYVDLHDHIVRLVL